jgi:DNA polymerase-3 subunit delta'
MHPWNAPIFESLKQRLDGLPHALLFHGPQGVGKLGLAEAVAQLMLCEHSEAAPRPCGSCEGCRWFLAGSHPDLRRIEPEALAKAPPADPEAEEAAAPVSSRAKPSTEIKVDQVRELAAFLNVGSHRGRRRVALVHPAEDITANAANALLKGLEEPPSGAMFLLVTHRPARLLPTIRSRCVAIPVAVPSAKAALVWLEGQGLRGGDRWLKYAGGAPLRALEYAKAGDAIDRLLGAIGSRPQIAIDDRPQLEALADALQKLALDHSMSAFGLPPKYGLAKPGKLDPKAWLAFARQMGENRLLARHPLNTRLFAAEMLAAMPVTKP